MRTRYDIKKDWGAWKQGQYVMLLTEPLELIEMGVLEDTVVTFDIPKHASIESVTYDDKEYEVGDTVEFTITVKSGYKDIKEVEFNNVDVSNDLTVVTAGEVYTLELTITQPNNVLNVEAYELASFTINEAAERSTTTYDDTKQYFEGDEVEFSITLASGYELDNIQWNATDVTGQFANDKITLTCIAGQNTLDVSAKLI